MEFVLENCKNPVCRNQIESLLATRDLANIIIEWVSDSRSIEILSGFDEVTDERRAYLIFNDSDSKVGIEDSSEVASAYCNKSQLLAQLPIISEHIPPPLHRKPFSFESSNGDEAFFERQAKLLGYEWNEDLCSNVYTLGAAIIEALGLALSEHGETKFSKLDSFSLEDIDNLDVYLKYFLSVHSLRADSKQEMYEGNFYYIDLRVDSAAQPSLSL